MRKQLKTFNIIVLLILVLPLFTEAQNSNNYCYSPNGEVAEPAIKLLSSIDQPPRLLINNDFDNKTIEILTNKGHMINNTSNAIGVPAIVLIDADGIKHAATDQKTDHYVNKLD